MNKQCSVILISLLLSASCDSLSRNDDDAYYDYVAASYIESVFLPDSILNGQEVPVVHFTPMGCTTFERIESAEVSDTLRLEVLYRFQFVGVPCAHGPGLDTTQYSLQFGHSGDYVVSYRKDSLTQWDETVFVK